MLVDKNPLHHLTSYITPLIIIDILYYNVIITRMTRIVNIYWVNCMSK